MNKITCICLGIRSMKKSILFYRDKLGFQTEEKGNNYPVIFFNTPGTKFELCPLDLLAEDISKKSLRKSPPVSAESL